MNTYVSADPYRYCGATAMGNHLAALKMIKMQGGVIGAVAKPGKRIETMT